MISADLPFARRPFVEGPTSAAGVALLAVTWALASSPTIPAWEEATFRFINGWPDWLEMPVWPVMQFGAIATVPLVAVAAHLVWRRWRVTLPLLAGPIGAWLLAKAVKELVGRGRPADYLADVFLRPAWDGLGFVSGHAATAFAIATVMTPYVGRPWKIVVWALAIATGILRIYTAAHLPLDILGGAGLGTAAGAAVLLIGGVPGRALRTVRSRDD